MESIQAYGIQYDSVKDNKYSNEKRKERRLEKYFDKIQADDTLEISQTLEASVKESLARKQALKDEWVSIDKLWLKVAERKDWGKVKSSLDSSKPCKMSISARKWEIQTNKKRKTKCK